MSVPHTSPTEADDVLGDVARTVEPFLDRTRWAAITDSLARVRERRVRILIVGEAKRGKSTLVNAMFAAPILPTGVLPLTSVATEVTASLTGSTPASGQVRYLDGRTSEVGHGDVAALVSETGNPSNRKRVDRVTLTAHSPYLPPGTEVVDTPGTGSVIGANTEEAIRARSMLDVGLLVVAADPPVAAAELAIASEVVGTAAQLAVVVNKTDLVARSELPAILDFTRATVATALGPSIPVFPTALRRRDHGEADSGLGELMAWLARHIETHGESDVVTSTARSLRRQVTKILDQTRIEIALAEQNDRANYEAINGLRDIVGRARFLAASATDRIDGERRRLRNDLDGAYLTRVDEASRNAFELVDNGFRAETDRPEDEIARLRRHVEERAWERAREWFEECAQRYSQALAAVSSEALASLSVDLRKARETASELVTVTLSSPDEPPAIELPSAPRMHGRNDVVWRELLSGSISDHLPARLRRRRLHRQLRRSLTAIVDRPYGRARAGLQSWLAEASRHAQKCLTEIWDVELEALARALSQIEKVGDQDRAPMSSQSGQPVDLVGNLERALRRLDKLIEAN